MRLGRVRGSGLQTVPGLHRFARPRVPQRELELDAAPPLQELRGGPGVARPGQGAAEPAAERTVLPGGGGGRAEPLPRRAEVRERGPDAAHRPAERGPEPGLLSAR